MDLREDERTAGTDPEAAAAPLQDAGGHGAEILASSSGGPPVGDAHGEGPAAPPGPAQELPARGPYAGRREVTGWDGTYESAVDAGIINRPPPLSWNRWQQWRKSDEGAAPTVQADGHGRDSRHEAIIYARVMRLWYGANYREAARQFTAEHPDWRPPPPVEEEAAPIPAPAPAGTPMGKGKGKGEVGEGRSPQVPPLPVLGRASVAASAADVGSNLTGEGADEEESLRGTEGTNSTFVTPRTLMTRMENPYDPEMETLIEYQDRMHKDALKARHLGMDLDLNKLQLKLDKAEIIEQLNDFSEEESREIMKQMLSDAIDASRPRMMTPDARQHVDRKMHALMELFADKHMNQDFIRLRQAEFREPVAFHRSRG